MSNSRRIETRSDLFRFLQTQMHRAYGELRDSQSLQSESTLIKSYIFEVDLPEYLVSSRESSPLMAKFIGDLFMIHGQDCARSNVIEKDEPGFFEVSLVKDKQPLILYLDTSTNPRFWFGYSMSKSRALDWWFETLVRTRTRLDFVWLWPAFLERIQERGAPRGFGLDCDYREFLEEDSDMASHLKMQLWGGRQTKELYDLLKRDKRFGGNVVLSKVRLKEFGDSDNRDVFALQDVKYNGKFTTRGNDFHTHAATLSHVRAEYEKAIRFIEDVCTLRWRQNQRGGCVLEGYAINFIPEESLIPVERFCSSVLDGTAPFRLLGVTRTLEASHAIVEVVDLHTGGEMSIEIYPDLLSVYLADGTCGNSIARLYTSLQHFFNVRFAVENDNGDTLF